MRYVLAIAALVAAAAFGALVFPRHERHDGPLADLVGENMTIISAERLDGDGRAHPQLVVTWGRTDPDQGNEIVEEGVSVYDVHESGRRYRRTFEFDPPEQVKQDRNPIGHTALDLDGDGYDEILMSEDLDGSAGNRIYHLLTRKQGQTREILRKELAYDDGLIMFGTKSLVEYQGVDRQPGNHGIHCCWLAYRLTARDLRGGRLVVVKRSRASRLPSVSDPPYDG